MTSVSQASRGAETDAALSAWRRASGKTGTVEAAPLQLGAETTVWRLSGIRAENGISDTAIAKRAPTGGVENEVLVYRDVLPLLPVSAPRFFGTTLDEDAQFSWLFLEDLGSGKFVSADRTHGELLARWLGTMNVAASALDAPAGMPSMQTDTYFETLRSGEARLAAASVYPWITDGDKATLGSMLVAYEFIGSNWNEIVEFCRRMPTTLVHGDISPKNVLVRFDGTRSGVFPIDWEMASWGVPAADVCEVDVSVYFSVVRESWPEFSLEDWQRLRWYGTIFRILGAVHWACDSLDSESVNKPIQSIKAYRSRLDETFLALDWNAS